MKDIVIEKVDNVLEKFNINKRVDKFTFKMYKNFIESEGRNIRVKENLLIPETDEELKIVLDVLLFINQHKDTRTANDLTIIPGFYNLLLNLANK